MDLPLRGQPISFTFCLFIHELLQQGTPFSIHYSLFSILYSSFTIPMLIYQDFF